jgi:hypothetical protein
MKVRIQILGKLLSIVAFLCLTCTAGYAQSVIAIVVPNNRASIDGNSGSGLPFANRAPLRWQQVYDASQFSAINQGGGWIHIIFFRIDGECRNGFGTTVSNLQINLSTTSKMPDGLNSIFAENVGAEDRIVFGPALVQLVEGCSPGTPPPAAFGMFISFTNPFYYNPSVGNLLMDIRNFSGGTDPGMNPGLIDGELTTGDSVSRVFATDVNATSALVRDSFGLITDFAVWPNPQLSIQLQTNSLVLSWPADPGSFLLQTITNLVPQPQWQTITNGIEQNGSTKSFAVPVTSAGKEGYFRLVSPP